MKGRIAIFALAAGVLVAGCKRYDDSSLWQKIDNHEGRIAGLEEAVAQLQSQLRQGALISSVTPLADNAGWRINFTEGTPAYIDVFHGNEGTMGATPPIPVIEVRNNLDGTTTIWVDYGDGFENTGVDITGPGGSGGGTGTPGADGVTPLVETRHDATTGETTLWVNITPGYPPAGWVDTGIDLTGPAGEDAITPVFEVRNDTLYYNVTLDYPTDAWVKTDQNIRGPEGHTPYIGEDGYWYINGEKLDEKAIGVDGVNPTIGENGNWWIDGVDTGKPARGAAGTNGTNGTNGADGVSPIIEVRENDNGTTTIWYNNTRDYPSDKWVNTNYPLEGIGPVKAISKNADGTVTVTMNDDENGPFTFEQASNALRFEIMSYGTVNAGAGGGEVRFVVNPSTATIPTSANGDMGKWHLNGVGTRAPGYVQPSALAISSITPSANGQGEYIATLTGTYDEAVTEHIVALVLNTGATDAPVLVSSEPFAVAITQPVVTPVISITTQPAAETEVTEWIIPADTRLNVAATVTEGAALSYQWYVNSAPDVVGGTSIPGATGTSYSIPTDTEAGVYYYYAVVSATGGALPVASDFAKVTVTADREHQDKGVVINGLTWATRNVGSAGTFVATPQDYGELFNFNDAQSACPAGWRTPTLDELKTLYDSGSVWVTGTPNGRRFGPEGKNIFMPAAGWWDDFPIIGGLKDRETLGSYWSSTSEDRGLFGGGWAYYSMDFDRNGVDYDYGNGDRDHGMSLRCVKEE